MSELATWTCHKVVKAGKIIEIATLEVTVEDVNGAPCRVQIPTDFFARGVPHLRDYLVIYEDGYKSWSPNKAFEDGYTRKPAS
jgi:hypothetical protein